MMKMWKLKKNVQNKDVKNKENVYNKDAQNKKNVKNRENVEIKM